MSNDPAMMQIHLTLEQLRDMLSKGGPPLTEPPSMVLEDEAQGDQPPHLEQEMVPQKEATPHVQDNEPAAPQEAPEPPQDPYRGMYLNKKIEHEMTHIVPNLCAHHYQPTRQFIKDIIYKFKGREGMMDDVGAWTESDPDRYLVLNFSPGHCEVQVNGEAVTEVRYWDSLIEILYSMIDHYPNEYLRITPDIYGLLCRELIPKFHLPSPKLVDKFLYSLPQRSLESELFQKCARSDKEICHEGVLEANPNAELSDQFNYLVRAYTDKIPGGIGDDKIPSDFDPTQLREGIRIELEHTDDFEMAREIAIDHLTEDESYYIKLKTIEEH